MSEAREQFYQQHEAAGEYPNTVTPDTPTFPGKLRSVAAYTLSCHADLDAREAAVIAGALNEAADILEAPGYRSLIPVGYCAVPVKRWQALEAMERGLRRMEETLAARADALTLSDDLEMQTMGEHYQGIAEEVAEILEPTAPKA